ncbi:MAG: hypothetical protein ACLFSE_08130 [Spirochaetia bacterium]
MKRSMVRLIDTPLYQGENQFVDLLDAVINIQEWILRYYMLLPKHQEKNNGIVLSPPFQPYSWNKETRLHTDSISEIFTNAPLTPFGMPVTWEDEIKSYNYFSDKPKWRYLYINDLPEVLRKPEVEQGDITKKRKNPNLKPVSRLLKAQMYANKTYIGILEDMIFDEKTWKIEFFIVKTSKGKAEQLFAVDSCWGTAYHRGDIILDIPRDKIQNLLIY